MPRSIAIYFRDTQWPNVFQLAFLCLKSLLELPYKLFNICFYLSGPSGMFKWLFSQPKLPWWVRGQKLEDMVCTYFHKTIVKLVFESKSEILRSCLVFLTIMATWIVGYKMCTKKHWKPHKILHKLVEKLALNILTEWMESRYLEILSFWSFRHF